MEPCRMTMWRFETLQWQHAGLCLKCGQIQDDGCEPDAEEYVCDACGAEAVMGMDNALNAGHIKFIGGRR